MPNARDNGGAPVAAHGEPSIAVTQAVAGVELGAAMHSGGGIKPGGAAATALRQSPADTVPSHEGDLPPATRFKSPPPTARTGLSSGSGVHHLATLRGGVGSGLGVSQRLLGRIDLSAPAAPGPTPLTDPVRRLEVFDDARVGWMGGIAVFQVWRRVQPHALPSPPAPPHGSGGMVGQGEGAPARMQRHVAAAISHLLVAGADPAASVEPCLAALHAGWLEGVAAHTTTTTTTTSPPSGVPPADEHYGVFTAAIANYMIEWLRSVLTAGGFEFVVVPSGGGGGGGDEGDASPDREGSPAPLLHAGSPATAPAHRQATGPTASGEVVEVAAAGCCSWWQPGAISRRSSGGGRDRTARVTPVVSDGVGSVHVPMLNGVRSGPSLRGSMSSHMSPRDPGPVEPTHLSKQDLVAAAAAMRTRDAHGRGGPTAVRLIPCLTSPPSSVGGWQGGPNATQHAPSIAGAGASTTHAPPPSPSLGCSGLHGTFGQVMLTVLRGCGQGLDAVLLPPPMAACMTTLVAALDAGEMKTPMTRLRGLMAAATAAWPDGVHEGMGLMELLQLGRAPAAAAAAALCGHDPIILTLRRHHAGTGSGTRTFPGLLQPPAKAAPSPLASPSSPSPPATAADAPTAHAARLLMCAIDGVRAAATLATVLDRSLFARRGAWSPTEVAALARYAHLPSVITDASRARAFSHAVATLLSACWHGDAVSMPPAGGIPAPFLWALTAALGMPLAAPSPTPPPLTARGEGGRTARDAAPPHAPATEAAFTLAQWHSMLDVTARSMLVHGDLCAALTSGRQVAAPHHHHQSARSRTSGSDGSGAWRDTTPVSARAGMGEGLLDVVCPVQQPLRVVVTRNNVAHALVKVVHHQVPAAGDRLAMPPSPAHAHATARGRGSFADSGAAPPSPVSQPGFRPHHGSGSRSAAFETVASVSSFARFTDAGTVRILHPAFRKPQSPAPGGRGGSSTAGRRHSRTSSRARTPALGEGELHALRSARSINALALPPAVPAAAPPAEAGGTGTIPPLAAVELAPTPASLSQAGEGGGTTPPTEGEGEGGGGYVEEGEGHGPRKELFYALAEEVTSPWRPWVLLPGTATPDPEKGDMLILSLDGPRLPAELGLAVTGPGSGVTLGGPGGGMGAGDGGGPSIAGRRVTVEAAEMHAFCKRLVGSKLQLRLAFATDGGAPVGSSPPPATPDTPPPPPFETVVTACRLGATGQVHVHLEHPPPSAMVSTMLLSAMPVSFHARRILRNPGGGAGGCWVEVSCALRQQPLLEWRAQEQAHWPAATTATTEAAPAGTVTIATVTSGGGGGAGTDGLGEGRSLHRGFSFMTTTPPESSLTDRQDGHRYHMLGWMMAAAIVNRCSFPVHLPDGLLSQCCVTPDVSRGHLSPQHARAAAAATKKAAADAAADTLRTDLSSCGFGRYVVSLLDAEGASAPTADTCFEVYVMDGPAFAALLAAEGLVAQRDPQQRVRLVDAGEVRLTAGFTVLSHLDVQARHAYAARAINNVVVEDARPHVRALRAGFRSALGVLGIQHLLQGHGLSVGQVAQLITLGQATASPSRHPAGAPTRDGGDKVDLQRLFRVVYDDEARECVPLQTALWATVNSWPWDKQMAFLRFVTGVGAPPLPGVEVLRVDTPFAAFGATQQAKVLATLPQAHSCTNTLELPNYWAALKATHPSPTTATDAQLQAQCTALLDAKLTKAIEWCDGYGLDEGKVTPAGGTSSPPATAAVPPPTPTTSRGLTSPSTPAHKRVPLISPTAASTAGGDGGGVDEAVTEVRGDAEGVSVRAAPTVSTVMVHGVEEGHGAGGSGHDEGSGMLLPGSAAGGEPAPGGFSHHAAASSWDAHGDLGDLLSEVNAVLGGDTMSPKLRAPPHHRRRSREAGAPHSNPL